ncbi:hypothetical protein GCM10017559_05670 [Streptosporangium longisporum]|uniref:Uncharacterized protein n=1 Tax=Streptosporangium longisporum TaxID=46187 RepID=A0ABN3XQZ0_9ACTN
MRGRRARGGRGGLALRAEDAGRAQAGAQQSGAAEHLAPRELAGRELGVGNREVDDRRRVTLVEGVLGTVRVVVWVSMRVIVRVIVPVAHGVPFHPRRRERSGYPNTLAKTPEPLVNQIYPARGKLPTSD